MIFTKIQNREIRIAGWEKIKLCLENVEYEILIGHNNIKGLTEIYGKICVRDIHLDIVNTLMETEAMVKTEEKDPSWIL